MLKFTENSNREIPHSAFRTPHSRQSRSGISIIEVMTAVVVAMIGVFGTLVLIPFAVKQAQSGLDLDDARNLAINSRATFEVMGFNDPDRFVTGFAKTNMSDTILRTQRLTRPPATAVMIDPMWINSNAGTGLDGNVGGLVEDEVRNNFGFFGDGVLLADPADSSSPNIASTLVASVGSTAPTVYPFHGQVHPVLPVDLRIRRVSMTSGGDSATLITPTVAQRLFQSTDSLNFSKFDTDDGDLAGQPFQIFDRDPAGNILRRQTDGGRLSQAMFIIPGDDQLGGIYRRVTLVFADRTFNLYNNPVGIPRPSNQADVVDPNTNVNLRSLMLSAMVSTRGAIPGGLPSGFQGGEIVLCPVDWDANSPPEWNQDALDVAGTPEAPGVRRDDWVMMINQLPAGYRSVPSARQQIQFYRVANIDEGTGLAGGANLPSLTLDGPAFDFGPDGATLPRIQTYIVHLRDVVNVFEDSITL
jgi:hypothetical protein